MTHIATVHLIILVFFTFGTTLIMIATVSNVVRLRNVEISWNSGKLYGFPLFATLFTGFTFFMTLWVYNQQLSHYTVPMLCYNWIGVNWFISSYLMSKRFVTDNGIVKNINDPSQTVAWSSIVDYVERNNGKDQTCIFFYTDFLPDEHSRNIRLELDVPLGKQSAFGQILQNKLGRRFSLGELENIGIEQFK